MPVRLLRLWAKPVGGFVLGNPNCLQNEYSFARAYIYNRYSGECRARGSLLRTAAVGFWDLKLKVGKIEM